MHSKLEIVLRVSGLIRVEPEANATATGTVPVGPNTEDTIGKPTPARFENPIVSACSDASALVTEVKARITAYQTK